MFNVQWLNNLILQVYKLLWMRWNFIIDYYLLKEKSLQNLLNVLLIPLLKEQDSISHILNNKENIVFSTMYVLKNHIEVLIILVYI